MKKAFTLSEILITLGIIGVVAAMTISNVIVNYQKKQTVVQLKKFYNEILQVHNKAIIDYDNPAGWEYPARYDTAGVKSFLEKYYMPYLKNSKYISSDNLHNKMNYKIKNLNNSDTVSTAGGLLLTDGRLLSFFTHGDYMWIFADINGLKGPNRAGRDIFVLYQYTPSYIGKRYTPIFVERFDCNKKLSDTYNGWGCGEKIQKAGWEIQENYPW